MLYVLASEFADIEVTVDHRGNGDRLMLRDLRGERVEYFDPLELETLVWSGRSVLTAQMDPSTSRWKDPE